MSDISEDDSSMKESVSHDGNTTAYDSELESAAPSRDLTIADSDDGDSDADASIMMVRRKPIAGKKKRAAIIDSESESDSAEDEYEARALSPRTRMSITGIRPADLTDDSSEIEYSDDERREEKKGQLSNISEINDTTGQADDSKNSSAEGLVDRHSLLEQSAFEKSVARSSTINSSESIVQNSDVAESSVSDPSSASLNLSANKDVSIIHHQSPARYSSHFASNIRDKLCSTLHEPRDVVTEIDSTAESDIIESSLKNKKESENSKGSSGDSDVQIIEKKEKPIILSSDDDDTENALSFGSKQSDGKLVQPKISAALTKVQTTNTNKTLMTPMNKNNMKNVSQEYYDKEIRKLNELKSELNGAECLLAKISKTLPDGGRQLSLRIERLKTDVTIKSRYIESLCVEDAPGSGGPLFPEDDKDSPSQKLQELQKNRKAFLNNQAPGWDELSAAVNQIQPIHTGKQGMATFNNQKVLTVERLKDLHGSLESCPAENVLAEDPKGLKVPLMEHQKHALAWMFWRERQKPRGGILADDMGLGKTLTMISLVLACKNSSEEEESDDKSNDEEGESSDDGQKAKKWHSKGRRDFYHGGTLVVCPASLIRQWEAETQTRVSRHRLTVCVHHGNNRDTRPKHLKTYDIVVTTYNIVAREEKSEGALFGIRWKRIILDEAHVIRNNKAQSSIAVCKLKGKRRWALTGTPIQNKEMDVYALLKFLRCTPFDDLAHWKRWIDKSAGGQQRLNTIMTSLMLRRTKTQLQQRGELQSLPNKTVEVIDVELDKDEMNVYQKIMIYSRTLFAQFLFQRAERNTDMMYIEQSARPTYMQSKDPNGAYYKMHQKFTKLHQGNKEVKSHEILVLLLRLRQICCHPGLIDAMLEDDDAQHLDVDSDNSQPEIDLLEQLNQLAITDKNDSKGLSHSLHSEDGNTSMRPEDAVMAKASARVLQRSNPVFNVNRPSTKMVKVLETLKNRVIAAGDKAIVVSQWTGVLDILKTFIEREGVATLSLNGSIPVKNRQDIVEEFNKASSSKRILLLSLTAGGVGLNLVGANHLLLIDLHWNPQLEAQAQDRIYRVGQKKDVVIYKFMCKETVEERIKNLQEHKLALANGVLTGAGAGAGSKLSMDDLRGLFGL